MTTYTVTHRIYDDFGFIGIDTQTHNADTPNAAYKLAQASIAGQFDTKLVSIEDADGQTWNTFNERV